MIRFETLIEIMGQIASISLVGLYALNITGRLAASSKLYVLDNIIGGVLFVLNTY